MDAIIKTVRVTIEKEIKITIPPEFFKGQTIEEYLAEFREGLWDVEGMDEVIEHAAYLAASMGGGYAHDGLGNLDAAYSKPDVIFEVLDEDTTTEIIDDEED